MQIIQRYWTLNTRTHYAVFMSYIYPLLYSLLVCAILGASHTTRAYAAPKLPVDEAGITDASTLQLEITDQPSSSAPILDETLYRELARLEPGVEDCLDALARIFERSSQHFTRQKRKARRANWLPEYIRAQALVRRNQREEWQYTSDQDFDDLDVLNGSSIRDRTIDDSDRRLEVRVQVQWDLSGVVYSDDDVAIERLRQRHRDDFLEQREQLLEAFFNRREAQFNVLRHAIANDKEALLQSQLAVAMASSYINMLTDGWFSEELERREIPEGAHIRFLQTLDP